MSITANTQYLTHRLSINGGVRVHEFQPVVPVSTSPNALSLPLQCRLSYAQSDFRPTLPQSSSKMYSEGSENSRSMSHAPPQPFSYTITETDCYFPFLEVALPTEADQPGPRTRPLRSADVGAAVVAADIEQGAAPVRADPGRFCNPPGRREHTSADVVHWGRTRVEAWRTCRSPAVAGMSRNLPVVGRRTGGRTSPTGCGIRATVRISVSISIRPHNSWM